LDVNMLQTLFLIPHEIAGLPVFGFGWALLAWTLVCAAWLVYVGRTKGFGGETWSYLPVMLVVAAALAFVAPRMEIPFDKPIGLPIRGYGVMMLLGVVSAVGITVYRARRMGLDPEVIFSLAFVMFLAGIVGARLFFVLQYWEQYAADPWQVFNVTQGGLVVYGSVLGGVPAGVYYLWRHKQPILAVGDLIAPGMLIGLAFGRIGCLMNGCCFGGVCEDDWTPRVTFPRQAAHAVQDSPPYMHQHQLGELHGVRIGADDQGRPIVQKVYDDAVESVRRTLRPGDLLRAVQLSPRDALRAADRLPQLVGMAVLVEREDGQTVTIPIHESNSEEGGGQIGIEVEPRGGAWSVKKVIAGRPAELTGQLFPGTRLRSVTLPSLTEIAANTEADDTPAQVAQTLLLFAGPRVDLETDDGRIAQVALDKLPDRTRPVHPTQIYSAANAFLLCAFLWVLYPFRRRDGEVFAAMLLLYPLARFLEEAIRTDEPGQFGTPLTISQWISVAIFLLGAALLVWLFRRPLGSALPPQALTSPNASARGTH
jgi:phosphatidylglycerol:prolipoprotein diacylglycerol transferase